MYFIYIIVSTVYIQTTCDEVIVTLPESNKLGSFQIIRWSTSLACLGLFCLKIILYNEYHHIYHDALYCIIFNFRTGLKLLSDSRSLTGIKYLIFISPHSVSYLLYQLYTDNGKSFPSMFFVLFYYLLGCWFRPSRKFLIFQGFVYLRVVIQRICQTLHILKIFWGFFFQFWQ